MQSTGATAGSITTLSSSISVTLHRRDQSITNPKSKSKSFSLQHPLRFERSCRTSRRRRKGWLLTMTEHMSEGIHIMSLSSSGKKLVEKGGVQPIPRLDDHLGPMHRIHNPMMDNKFFEPTDGFFVTDYDVATQFVAVDMRHLGTQSYFLRAGPRESVVFEPEEVKAAIVTCGGLCPGINTVIRELVMGLWDLYGVRSIHGIRAGYRGFYSGDPMPLDRQVVDDWHKKGGSVLGSSRGGFDLKKIMDGIEGAGYNQLFIVGGDGTMRGAVAIADEIVRRGLKISVVAVPKTVDNDVGIIDKSFGLDTAVEKAQAAINAGHVEAQSTPNGVGVVKLMGRNAGHIALRATLSSRDVDCCLIPEVPFYTEGRGGLFEFVETKLEENGHCVIVVAEGAGQELIPRNADQGYDESGNLQLLDIGTWLVSELKRWWKKNNPDKLSAVKYIDPTYMVRAVPSNAADTLFCTLLAQSAVHGAMAGYTAFVAGTVNGVYCYLPLEQIAKSTHKVDVNNHIWAWVRSINSQPDFKKYNENGNSNGKFVNSESGYALKKAADVSA
ncbi:hypothetical protein R1flu_016934 [Riccia fluitans]|uniref:ATP-dependent 6-phosphofructokinase n=1 Tax=Riccia fluitans TaxID=41844 RepID=A0ABD1YNI7_9MARC